MHPWYVTLPADRFDETFPHPSLFARITAGDESALAEAFREYGQLVYGTAYRLTALAADAEDVTQEVFLRLPSALDGFTGMSAAFPSWLRRVTVRQALMHLRSSRRRREVDVESVVNLFGAPSGVDERLTLQSALARLSSEHRMVFLLKEVEGYQHPEIAELLGISVANSEVRLHRARKELRAFLKGSR